MSDLQSTLPKTSWSSLTFPSYFKSSSTCAWESNESNSFMPCSSCTSCVMAFRLSMFEIGAVKALIAGLRMFL
ncbi:hypothetical protein FGO68_gene15297 [Halteria grandinella]|uniref:Uncharacterized protein n=1 Tax=Halteria grandinella TaxID=5974 RepID=A0A8J8NU54_HALGN|nr:hypothetical protein FGO68_gene15297 [Halteria grandinella]